MMASQDWKAKSAAKRAEVFDQIPKDWQLPEGVRQQYNENSNANVLDVPRICGILSDAELDITENYDATQLVEKLSSGVLTSLEVTTAFCKRAAIAAQVTNCLTEIFFDKALERAKFVDDYYAREKKPIGPLHGLPISLKDCFKVKGVESTVGYVAKIGNSVADNNSCLVDILLDLGAVLYVKTNIPQTLMTGDSDNNVFGRTLNPHKLSLTAGGSSGGEGALVAMRGSILGVGTDIAGSIRIPALCCGAFGFKPTADRVPYGGQENVERPGRPGIIASAGPLTTSVRDLELFLQSVLSHPVDDYDTTALAVGWRPVPQKSKLTIGVLQEDPAYPLFPPVARSLATAVEKLRAAGHIIVPFDGAPSLVEPCTIGFDFFSLDNTKAPFKVIESSGEPLVPSVVGIIEVQISKPEGFTLEELFDLNTTRSAYSAQWTKAWVDAKIDVLIGPGAETTAVPHDTYGYPPYTVAWNYLDYPSAIIPFRKADKSGDTAGWDASKSNREYLPEAIDGAPCAIQVVARRLHDEELLQATKIIANVLAD